MLILNETEGNRDVLNLDYLDYLFPEPPARSVFSLCLQIACTKRPFDCPTHTHLSYEAHQFLTPTSPNGTSPRRSDR